MELSKRLQAVADLVSRGAFVADIGTDHAYIPIYLIRQGICRKVIAADINEGPLLRAREHIREAGYEAQILTRKSDGLSAFYPGEVDCMVASGMGGSLMIHILEEQKEVAAQIREFILQPQSELFKFRSYLNLHGYQILKEDMIFEDGKYYPMMKVVHGEPEAYTECEYQYGKYLLAMHHPVLFSYLQHEKEIKTEILSKLSEKKESAHIDGRKQEMKRELALLEQALSSYLLS